jgi:hypothetical protein
MANNDQFIVVDDNGIAAIGVITAVPATDIPANKK